MSEEAELVTLTEAAAKLHAHPDTIKGWIHQGLVEAHKETRNHRTAWILPDDLQRPAPLASIRKKNAPEILKSPWLRVPDKSDLMKAVWMYSEMHSIKWIANELGITTLMVTMLYDKAVEKWA